MGEQWVVLVVCRRSSLRFFRCPVVLAVPSCLYTFELGTSDAPIPTVQQCRKKAKLGMAPSAEKAI